MRIALGIEYDGCGFKGWQSQLNLPTVQAHVEKAVSRIANQPILLQCAGRTDAGVHAVEQVVHFECDAKRDLKAWTHGVNSYLPSTIAIKWAKEVPADFHARFSAFARTYRYLIYNHRTRPALFINKVCWRYEKFNIEAMQLAASYLLGENDFSSFRSSQCEASTPMRCIYSIMVRQDNNFIIIDIKANAFLHHMVRNIVGVLIRIGRGLSPPSWMDGVLKAKDRREAAETAFPGGLYLLKVDYPSQYNLPPSQDLMYFGFI